MSTIDGVPPLALLVIEDDGLVRSLSLAKLLATIRESDEDTLQRLLERSGETAPERRHAASLGARAGQVGERSEDIKDEQGSTARYFRLGGERRARAAEAEGRAAAAAKQATAGPAAATKRERELRDGLLEEEQKRHEESAAIARAKVSELRLKRADLDRLNGGLIGVRVEWSTTLLLGVADFITLALFLTARSEIPEALSWGASFLAGLGAAIVGWAFGRGALAQANEDRRAKWTLLAMLVLAVASAIWFVDAMHAMRDGNQQIGVSASITFGAPLCAMTLAGTAIVSFVGGAGAAGFALDALIEDLQELVQDEEAAATKASGERHRLRQAEATAEGANAGALPQLDSIAAEATENAAAARAHGDELWGLFGIYAELFPKPEDIDDARAFELAALDGDRMGVSSTSHRLLVAAVATIGALTVGLGAMALDATTAVVALAAGVGASLCGLIGARWLPPAIVRPRVAFVPAAGDAATGESS
jgi:hypothetical protein